MAAPPSSVGVGALLRQWRLRRRRTQLDLALSSGVSTRHLSYVENGRAQPSAEMVLQLAEHLEVPLGERNTLLLAAGFAPRFGRRGLDDRAMGPVRDVLDRVLAGHEPWPAVVIDRHWGLVAANAAIGFLTAGAAPHLLEPPVNVLRLSLHPEGLAPRIENLAQWRGHLLEQVGRQAATSGDPALAALLDEMRGYPGGVETHAQNDARAIELAVMTDIAIPLRLKPNDGGPVLSFLSTRTTFATAVDLTVAELAIESFFPADAATSRRLRDTSD